MKAHLTTLLVALILFHFVAQRGVLAQNNEERTRLYTQYMEEKDPEVRCARAKELLEQFPNLDGYWGHGIRKFVATCELQKIYYKCQEADKTFFAAPSSGALNDATAACDIWLDKCPKPDVYYTTRLALATGYGILANFYKDTNRSFSYGEKALQMLVSEKPPEGWKPEDWQAFRRENIGRLRQYQGLFKLRQEPPDAEAAIDYLTKAAETKDGPAFKDINTYLLRADANEIRYKKLRAEFDNLSARDRADAKGQELAKQITAITNNLAHDYARVVVLVEREDQVFVADAKAQLRQFCKQQGTCITSFIKLSKKEFGIK